LYNLVVCPFGHLIIVLVDMGNYNEKVRCWSETAAAAVDERRQNANK
jgi:hypothetical protein